MRLFALLLLVGVAQAQGLTTRAPGQAGQKRTNYAYPSNAISSGALPISPWVSSGGLSLVTTAGGPFGTSWTTYTSTLAGHVLNIPSVTVPSSTVAVFSVTAKKAAGTGKLSIYTYMATGSATECVCVRSDGGICAAALGFTNKGCVATATVSSTADFRIYVRQTSNSANTGVQVGLAPGEYGVGTGESTFAAPQLEVGVTKASAFCSTTTAARTCK
jgi:hypothetical protein